MCDKNPEKIKEMFDKISPYYDKMNNFISLGLHNIVKKQAVKMLKIAPRSMVLDLCCGTGDFTKIIDKVYPRAKVIGLDNSVEMIKIAKNKNPKKAFLKCDCTDLGFGEGEFDAVTIGFGLRNIENRKKALEEIRRVLKPDGKFLHLDFGYQNRLSAFFDFVVPFIAKYVVKDEENYKYLIESKNSYPEPDELIKEFQDAGFEFAEQKNFLRGTVSAILMRKKCEC